MEWVKTAGDHTDAVGYDAATQTVYVRFSDSSVYRYKNVPQSVYDELLQSGSPGRYTNIVLRRGYQYEKVS